MVPFLPFSVSRETPPLSKVKTLLRTNSDKTDRISGRRFSLSTFILPSPSFSFFSKGKRFVAIDSSSCLSFLYLSFFLLNRVENNNNNKKQKDGNTHLGPSKSIIAPAWYQVTLLGEISCTSTIHVKLIVLPFFTYTSSGPVIFACTSGVSNAIMKKIKGFN